jgi:hypothetical protein
MMAKVLLLVISPTLTSFIIGHDPVRSSKAAKPILQGCTRRVPRSPGDCGYHGDHLPSAMTEHRWPTPRIP